jgi:hypothetical protein
MTSFAFWLLGKRPGGFYSLLLLCRKWCGHAKRSFPFTIRALLFGSAQHLRWDSPVRSNLLFFFSLYLDSKKLGPVFFLSFSSSSLPIHFIPLDRGTILRLDLAMSLIHYSICLALIHIAYANGISATFPQISIKVGPFFLFFSSFNVDFHSPKCAYTVYV